MRGGERKKRKKERKINLPKEPSIHKGFALCEKKRAVKEEEKLQLRAQQGCKGEREMLLWIPTGQ